MNIYIHIYIYKLFPWQVIDSPVFFPFGDTYARVATAFFRDPQVAALCVESLHSPLILRKPLGTSASGARQYVELRSKVMHAMEREAPQMQVPPAGVIPFYGFAFYMAPLAFITESASKMLAIFRAMFCRYWCRLNVVRSTPGSLLSICALFERLLKRNEGEVWRHLLQLDCAPLDIALPWIRFAFAGFGSLRKRVSSDRGDILSTAAAAPDPAIAGVAGRPLHPEMNRRWGYVRRCVPCVLSINVYSIVL